MKEKKSQAFPYWSIFFGGIALALIAILLAPYQGRSAFDIGDGIVRAPLSLLEYSILIGGVGMAFYGLAAWIHAPRLTVEESIAWQQRTVRWIGVFIAACVAATALVVTPPFTILVMPFMIVLTIAGIYPALVFPISLALTTGTIVLALCAALMFYGRRQPAPTES